MADSDTRTIRVVITLEGSDLGGVSADVEGDVSADTSSKGGDSGSKTNKRMKSLIKSQIYGYARKAVNFSKETLNSYYNLQENYKAANDVNNANELISSALSFAKSASFGYAAAGNIGLTLAVIGFVGAKVIGVGKSYISESERLAELAYNKRYKSEALGLIDESRGTEN